jgi:steroid 5-alpha reductase family enzyme
MDSFWSLLIGGVVFAIVIMIATWLFAKKVNNYSVVDAVWAISFFLLSGLYCFAAEGWGLRKILVLAVVAMWSLRLGIFLAIRIKSHHPEEDLRYKQLRSEYGDNVGFRFFLFFIYQGLSVAILTLPFLEMFGNAEAALHPLEIAGACIVVLSLCGEAIADAQASAFKAKPENKLKTCDVGLWRYSRHPNYFFESCVWWGFYIMTLGTPGTAYTIFAPLTILLLLLKVTGVPPSEAQALKKRGEVYRQYQRRTSMFIPWFPKKNT